LIFAFIKHTFSNSRSNRKKNAVLKACKSAFPFLLNGLFVSGERVVPGGFDAAKVVKVE